MLTLTAAQQTLVDAESKRIRWQFFIEDKNGVDYDYGSLTPDLLEEDCAAIADWTDGDSDTAVSEVDPAGQFRFDTNLGAAGDATSQRWRALSAPPDQFTIEIKTYFDAIGSVSDTDEFRCTYMGTTWRFTARFASDGLFIMKTGGASAEVGTNIVKTGVEAALQTWRFQVDKTAGEDAATVEVFLDNVSQGTFDCDYETASTSGRFYLTQYGYTTDNMVSHIDYINVATGLGDIAGGDSTTLVLMDFSGIELRRNLAENSVIAPSDVTFSLSNPANAMTFSDFKGGTVHIELWLATTTVNWAKIAGWKFRIKTAEPGYQKIRIVAEDFLQYYLRGDYPNTRIPEDIFKSNRTYAEHNGLCIPVPFGTAYIPLRDVYIDNAITYTASTLAAVASAAGAPCQITDSADGLAVFEQGRIPTVTGFTETENNVSTKDILSVAAGVLEFDIDAGFVGEVEGDAVTISQGSGYIMLGSPAGGITYTITKVHSPRALAADEYSSGTYTFTQSTIADADAVDWRVFQAKIFDLDKDGTADNAGFWQTTSNQFYDPLVELTRSDTATLTNPADVTPFVLEDMGVPSAMIDDAAGGTFASCHTTFDSYEWETETELMPNTVDRDFSGASAWAKVDIDAYDETGDLTVTASAANQYCTCPVASAPTTVGKTYKLTVTVANLVSTFTIKSFDGTQTLASITADGAAQEFFFTATTTGGYRVVADADDSSADFDDFSLVEAGLQYHGAFWYKQPREKVLAQLLTQCHSCLDIGETIKMRVLSKTSKKTITAAEILRPSEQGEGSFTYRDIVNTDYSDSCYAAWQKSGEPQDQFLKVLVAADLAANVISQDILECPFVQDSKFVQKIVKLHGQRKYLKEAEIGFLAKGTCVALQPDDVITINNANYGGEYDVLIDSMKINKDLSIQFQCSKYTSAFDDWADLTPTALTIPDDDTPYAWKPAISGPTTAKDIGRSAFDTWGKEYLTVGPQVNVGKETNLQKALNAVKQAGGGSIYILNGTYQMTSSIYVPDVNLEVFGQSQGGVMLKNLDGSDLFVLNNLTKTFHFEGFSIESQNTAVSSKMFNVYGDDATLKLTLKRIAPNLAGTAVSAHFAYVYNADENDVDLSVADCVAIGKYYSFVYYANSIGSCDVIKNKITGFQGPIFIAKSSENEVASNEISSEYINAYVISAGLAGGSPNALSSVHDNCLTIKTISSAIEDDVLIVNLIYAQAVGGTVLNNKIIVLDDGLIYNTLSAINLAVAGVKARGNEITIANSYSYAHLHTTHGMYMGANGGEAIANTIEIDVPTVGSPGNQYGIIIIGNNNIVAANSPINLTNSAATDIGIKASGDNNRGQDNIFTSCGKNISDAGTGNTINKSSGGTF